MHWALPPAQGLRVQPIHACELYSSGEVHYDCSTKACSNRKTQGLCSNKQLRPLSTRWQQHQLGALPAAHTPHILQSVDTGLHHTMYLPLLSTT